MLGKPAVNESLQKLDKHKQKKIEDLVPTITIPIPESKPIARPAPVQSRPAAVEQSFSCKSHLDIVSCTSAPEPQRARVRREEPPAARVNISNDIIPDLLDLLRSRDWQEKEEGLNQITAILNNANNFIQPKLGSLLSAYRSLLSDNNPPKIDIQALAVFSNIVTAVGPEIESQLPAILPAFFKFFGDNRVAVRSAVAESADKIIEQMSMDVCIPYTARYLSGTTGRKEILEWIIKHIPASIKKKESCDFRSLTKASLLALNDKLQEVRKLAEILLAQLIPFVGTKFIEEEVLASDFSSDDCKIGVANQTTAEVVRSAVNRIQCGAPPGQRMKRSKSADSTFSFLTYF